MPFESTDDALRPRLGVLVWRLAFPLMGFLAAVGVAVFVVWPPEWADGSAASRVKQWLCVLVVILSGPTVLAGHYLVVRHRFWRFTPEGLAIGRGDRVVHTIARDQLAEIRVRAAGMIAVTTEQQTRFLTYVDRASAESALAAAA